MKKRGMHWSRDGLEAVVKVKRGILNKTLRPSDLAAQKTSDRKQRETRRLTNRVLNIFKEKKQQSVGVKFGKIPLYVANSTATGKIKEIFGQKAYK